jgi:phenylalanyl-tRNA synthetase beta chain
LSEALTYSFVSARELELLHAPAPCVFLANPMSEERSVMRTSLLPGLLEALRRARRHGERGVRLFTIGSRFLPRNPSVPSTAGQAVRPRHEEDLRILPEERPSFAAVLAGPRPTYLAAKPDEIDLYDAKAVATELVERLTRQRTTVRHVSGAGVEHLHPRGAAEVLVGDVRVGLFGPLHPDVVESMDLEGPAHIVELDLSAIENLGKPTPRFQPIPRLPAVTRDLAIELDELVPVAEVEDAIERAAGELCESVELFDVFRGAPVAAGRRSLAFRIVYRDPLSAKDPDHARTLTDEEVDRQQSAVLEAIRRLGGALRG